MTETDSPTGVGGHGFFRRQPWWVWCCSLPFAVVALSLYLIVFAAPHPAGWRLWPVKDDGRAVAYRVLAVAGGTAAERAAFEADDLVSIADVERFVRGQQPDVGYRFDVVHAGRRQARTLTLGRNDWIYWSSQEGLRRLAVTIGSVPYLALGGILLFARPRDRGARWGALLFTQIGLYMLSFVSPVRPAPETAYVLRVLPLPLGVLIGLPLSIASTIPAGTFGFCAVFPKPLPLSNQRWWPWWLSLIALLATTGVDLEFIWLPIYAGPGRPDVPVSVMAATSDDSGREEGYVKPFPGPGMKRQVSSEGGSEPLWARNGRQLFYRWQDQVWVVDVRTDGGFAATKPRLLLKKSGYAGVLALYAAMTCPPMGSDFSWSSSGKETCACHRNDPRPELV